MSRRWAVAGAALAVVAIALTFKPAVEGDGVGYFSYLHSVWVDHDLDLADEYAAAFAAHVNVVPGFLTTRTATGRLADFFPVGSALLASPLYLAALAVHPDGRPVFGPPFTTAFGLASLLYGLLALALCYRLASAVTGEPRAAGLATLAIALGTPFAYYLLFEPSYSHTFSAFAVTVFLLVWHVTGERRSAAMWLGLGVLGGLMGAVRFQDGPLAALVLLDLGAAGFRAAAFVPGLVLGFLSQLLVDRVLFGSWLPVRPAGQDLQPLPGHYLEVLFSSNHGLFEWSPLLLLATAGAFLLPGRWRLAFAFAVVVEVLIDGAAPDWSGGFSFGARRLLDLTPFFVVGLAALAVRVGPRVTAVVTVVAAAWTVLLAANLTYVQRGDVDPGYGGLLAGQLSALPWVPRLFVQGAAGRDLLWWPVLGARPDWGEGVALLLLIAACVGAAALVAQARVPRRVTHR